MKYKLALDFGTTNTVMTYWNEAQSRAEVLPLAGLSQNGHSVGSPPPLIPSLVYLHDARNERVTVGQAVRERGLDQQKDQRLFRNFKRNLVAIQTPPPRCLDGVLWTDQDTGRIFLRRLLAEIPYPAAEIERLVITTPIVAFEFYLDWLQASLAGLIDDRVQIVDEATAAALGYAVIEPEAVVLVFDFGGGTLDVSLVQLPESRAKTGGGLSRLIKLKGQARQHTARVIAKAGQVLGGSDIDHWLLTEVLRRVNITPESLGHEYAPLLTRCEKAKIALSTAAETGLTFQALGQTYDLRLSRADLEALLEGHGFFGALRRVLDKVMSVAHQRGIYREDIRYVLMVGGTSLMPAVQHTLSGYFSNPAIRSDKPFTAVAEGALQLALGFGLQDYLAHSYGLRHLDPVTGQHQYDEIIPMGSIYPSPRPVEVTLGSAFAGQEAIEFVIGEIDTDAVAQVEVKYENDQAVFVARADHQAGQVLLLNPTEAAQLLAPLTPPVTPGQERLKAGFWVDERRQLRLTVSDLLTGQELLRDAVIARLGSSGQPSGPIDSAVPTGREPRLSSQSSQQRTWQLSLRDVATRLSLLPPQAISLTAAEAALHHREFYVRYNAAGLLARRGDREARLIMQTALADEAAPVRASAARFLYGFSWYVAEPLLRQALQDADARVREAAIYALCDCQRLEAYHLMTSTLAHETDQVRAAAVWGLRERRDPAAVPVLAVALLANDFEIRVHALEVLGGNDLPEALPVVRQALHDVQPEVQYAATLSWLELAGEQGVPELLGVIETMNGAARAIMLRGFFHATNYLNLDLTPPPLLGLVLQTMNIALTDADPQVRLAAIWPLAWLHHPQATNLLKLAFHRELDSTIKAEMLSVMFNLLSEAGEELLAVALQSESGPVRERAVTIQEALTSGILLTGYEPGLHQVLGT